MNKFEDARMNKFEDARMNKFEDARSTGQKEENIMGKYEQDARLLLEYVGGKENIAAVSHCVSRMRFVLNDPAKADVAKIEALKSAKGTFTQAGQFQVIIGNTVSDFYNDFIAVSGIDGVSKQAEPERFAEGHERACGDFCPIDSRHHHRRFDPWLPQLH